jgi:hypothetical protein
MILHWVRAVQGVSLTFANLVIIRRAMECGCWRKSIYPRSPEKVSHKRPFLEELIECLRVDCYPLVTPPEGLLPRTRILISYFLVSILRV